MPYPILTLPYPFAKRLRQILNPFELEELQKAAGYNVLNALNPIVKSRRVSTIVSMSATHEKPACVLTYPGKHIDAPPANLIKTKLLDCTYLTSSSFESLTASQLLIKTSAIGFIHCHVSNALLKKLSKIVVQPLILDFCYCPRVDEDVKFSTIIKAFPVARCIQLGKAYVGWLNDLISTSKLLNSIEIVHDNFDELFSFKPAFLYGYVKVQYSTFRILLSYKVNASRYDWIIHMMQKFIDPRFDVEVNGKPKVILKVQLIDDESMCHIVRYYYKK